MYRLSNPRERYTELMAQVDRLKLHSTKFGQSRLVTATQLKISCVNCEWWEEKSCWWCFWHYLAKAQLHKSWSWNFLCMHRARKRK